MNEHMITRRSVLKVLAATGVAGGVLGRQDASAAPVTPGSGASFRDGELTDLIQVIRHGEKPATGNPELGITADGAQDSESLTTFGWGRAGALVNLFAPAQGLVRPGLARPKAVFASNQSGPDGGSAREVETVSFVSQQLGVTTNADYGVGDEVELIGAVTQTTGPILIAWEHDNIPNIAAALGNVTPAVPQTWPSDRFDVVWVFVPVRTRGSSSSSYRFYQVPELVMPGDLDTVIS